MKTQTKPTLNGKSISNVLYTKFNISEIQIDQSSSIRFEYDQEQLEELAESIRQNNNELLQPILITRIYANSDKDVKFLNESPIAYNVVAGRRRFLACRDILKLDKISAIVKEFDSFESEFKAQFAENEERVNWTDLDYTNAIHFLIERNPKITQQGVADIFGKNLNWVKKKQQHLSMIKDFPESSTPNLSTSILSEIKSLSPENKKDMIFKLNALSNQKLPLPSIKSIREEVKELNRGKKIDKSTLMLKSATKKSKNSKKDSTDNSTQIKDIYRVWKNSGKILDADKILLSEHIQSEIYNSRRELHSAEGKVAKLQPYLKNLISDSIALQEMPLFPNKNKGPKK